MKKRAEILTVDVRRPRYEARQLSASSANCCSLRTRDAEPLGVVELGTGVFARDEIIGLFAHAAGDLAARTR